MNISVPRINIATDKATTRETSNKTTLGKPVTLAAFENTSVELKS
jgi:hypothetical protein